MIDIAVRPGCLGCTFQVAAAEFAEMAHPAYDAAQAVKRRVRDELECRAHREGRGDPAALAERLHLLLEGVWAMARMEGAGAGAVAVPAAPRG